MAASDDADWDKDTDEINSLDSDELHETRPNRWKGAPSTWRSLTEQDRSIYQALERQRDKDLSIHLYNAFALKRKRRSGPPGVDHASHDWKPDKKWTAWPLPLDQVPEAGLMTATGRDDEDDVFTVRNVVPSRPGALLEDAIAATMLRIAKERFRARHADHNDDDVDDDEDDNRRGEKKAPCTSYEAVPSADDELSYRLLRPAARRIMERVDATLKVLHNTCSAAMAAYQMDSSDGGETSAEERRTAAPPTLKPKPTTKADSSGPPDPNSAAKMKNRGGRPRKVHVPLPGESEYDTLVRVARQQHRPKPVPVPSSPAASQHGENTTRDPSAHRPSGSEPTKHRPRHRRSGPVSTHQQRRIRQLDARNWRDVVGAAALAGFSPDVVARTAQRCASLFGEDMVLHELAEGSADTLTSTRYEPGPLDVPDYDDDDERDEQHVAQLRALKRHSVGRAAASSCSDDEDDDDDDDQGSRGRSRSVGTRSRRRFDTSRMPGGQRYFCPHRACPRRIEPFTRNWFLVRHMRDVHGDQVAEEKGDGDSADELDGAVHVDGFMKPIMMGSWRRDLDATKRKTRKKSRAVQEDEEGV